MSWITANLAEFFIIAGFGLLAIEILVLGFSTFFLFFIGLASVVTAALLWLGIVPDELVPALLSTAILTAISALLLWKPLKNMQGNNKPGIAESDLIGHSFILQSDVSPTQPGEYQYSGITWELISESDLPTGTLVKVIKTQVGKFHIAAKAS